NVRVLRLSAENRESFLGCDPLALHEYSVCLADSRSALETAAPLLDDRGVLLVYLEGAQNESYVRGAWFGNSRCVGAERARCAGIETERRSALRCGGDREHDAYSGGERSRDELRPACLA